MDEDEVLQEVIESYEEYLEMLPLPYSVNFLISQLCRRVVIARKEAERHKMALKRMELMK